MTWNGRKLMSYDTADLSIDYEYDANSLRTSKTINGVRHEYYYDENNQLIYEIKEGVYELYYKYDADGNLFSITRYRYSDGEKHVFYAVINTRGDVIELRSNTGAIYAKYIYDSWGKCISVTDSSGAACSVNTVAVQNSIRYRGYVYDHETGLYYLQSRYYDSETGRFLNADDAEYIGYSRENLSYNAFAYCENNAVNGEDPTGYKRIDITDKLFTEMRKNARILLSIVLEYFAKYNDVKAYTKVVKYFINAVKTGGKWDLKSKDKWKFKKGNYYIFMGKELRKDDPGNIHFGYVGRIIFGEKILRGGAGLYQIYSRTSSFKYFRTYFDDPRDSTMISLGSALFDLDRFFFSMKIRILLERMRTGRLL